MNLKEFWPGKIWPDADGRSPHCDEVWVSQSCWTTLSPTRAPWAKGDIPALEVLAVSVPPGMHEFQGVLLAESSASFRKWKDSGVGLVKVRTPSQVALALLDLAGRQDLAKLERAANESGVYAMPIAAGDPATPLVRIRGFREMLSEAAGLRRLSAQELTEAIVDFRAELRGPYNLLSAYPGAERVCGLTISVCHSL
jgi:hypothetical protein